MSYIPGITVCIYILQIATIHNALKLGWKVRKIGSNKYELTKKISELENFQFPEFINKISSTSLLV